MKKLILLLLTASLAVAQTPIRNGARLDSASALTRGTIKNMTVKYDSAQVQIISGGLIINGNGTTQSGGWSRSFYASSPADKPPTTPNALDDEFSAAATDTTVKWTWRNRTAKSRVQNQNGFLVFTDTGTVATDSWSMIMQPTADAVWTITTRMDLTALSAQVIIGGLIIYNTANSRFIGFGVGGTANMAISVTKWTGYSTWSANTYVSGNLEPWIFGSIYLQIEKVAGNLYFYISPNGIIWTRIYTESASTFMETSGSIDRLGVGADCAATTASLRMAFHWWRYKWTPDFNPAAGD